MSCKARLLLAFQVLPLLGMGTAVLSRGSRLPVLKTPSTSVGFVSASGVPLRRHGQFNQKQKILARSLNWTPFHLAAVAARDGGDISAGDKVALAVAKAKARLVKAECELDAAQEADPVDDQRVAKGEVGVAKAEFGVAKAEVGVAEAEWQAAPEREKAAFLANIAKAEVGVAKAEVGVAEAEWQAAPESEKAVFLRLLETARKAYEKALNASTATPLQGMPQQWREGKTLVGSDGAKWQYQRSDEMVSTIGQELLNHWTNFRRGSTDKQDHPLFLVLSGAGTGKSRLLDEFYDLCVDSVSSIDVTLTERLEQAYVFKIDFENDRGGDGFQDGKHSIGSRMLHQLSDEVWDKFRDRVAQITPTEVFEHVARIEGKFLPEMTFFLIVDGMQTLDHVEGSKSSKFFSAMQSVVNLVNCGAGNQSPLVIGCCSATTHGPSASMVQVSSQRQVLLQPPLLNGSKVFEKVIKEQDPLVNLLVGDMGGHGRALEALWVMLKRSNFSLDHQVVQREMEKLREELSRKYPLWFGKSDHIKPLLRAVLSRKRFDGRHDKLGGDISIDEYTSFGLCSWNEKKRTVDCAFILLWILAPLGNDDIIQQLVSGDYNTIQQHLLPWKSKPSWSDWESFVAKFRCLKSHVFQGERVPWSHLHAGAKMGSDVNQMVLVNDMENIVATSQHKTGKWAQGGRKSFDVDHQRGRAFIMKGKHLVPNAPGASDGDSFCSMELVNGDCVLEVQQAKMVKRNFNMAQFQKEREKACLGQDFFVLHLTGPSSITDQDLPARSALVDASNIHEYYGVFASRAVLARDFVFHLNTATKSHLMTVPGIGEKRADNILRERSNSHFTSIDDCAKRTRISTKILSHFRIGT